MPRNYGHIREVAFNWWEGEVNIFMKGAPRIYGHIKRGWPLLRVPTKRGITVYNQYQSWVYKSTKVLYKPIMVLHVQINTHTRGIQSIYYITITQSVCSICQYMYMYWYSIFRYSLLKLCTFALTITVTTVSWTKSLNVSSLMYYDFTFVHIAGPNIW